MKTDERRAKDIDALSDDGENYINYGCGCCGECEAAWNLDIEDLIAFRDKMKLQIEIASRLIDLKERAKKFL